MSYKTILFTLLPVVFCSIFSFGQVAQETVIHQDTAVKVFRVMAESINTSNNKTIHYNFISRAAAKTSVDFTTVYGIKVFVKSTSEITVSIKLTDANQATSSTVIFSIKSNSKGYVEYPLAHLTAAGFDLKTIIGFEISISATSTAYIDEIEFMYFKEEKESKKPKPSDLKKTLKEEKDKEKERRVKEFNKLQELEYRDRK